MNKIYTPVIFIHETVVLRDNSIGKLLITGDNTISLLPIFLPTCRRSVSQDANIIGFLQLTIGMGFFWGGDILQHLHV